MSHPEIHASGAVLWRRREAGAVDVAVVHRPRYDDWSLPKGKLDDGETVPTAAVREVKEETGFDAVLGRHLGAVRYEVPAKGGKTAPKVVDYFSAEARGGEFEENEEVDALRWLSPEQAETVLTRATDIDVLRTFRTLPPELTTLLLVRHAKAGKRDEWLGDDDLRPLSDAGLRQAAGVRELAKAFGPDRVHSAPRLRCVQTVQGVADDLGAEIEHEPLLSEEGYWKDPSTGLARLLLIVGKGGVPVISSQGGVIPDVVAALADRDGVTLPTAHGGSVASKKGSVWLLSFLPASGQDGSRLVVATYFPSALPAPKSARG